jgi:hypothetical protein
MRNGTRNYYYFFGGDCTEIILRAQFFFFYIFGKGEEEFELVTSASIGVVHSRLSYPLGMVVRFIDCFLKEAIINKVRKTLNFFKMYFGAFFFNLIFNYIYIFWGGLGRWLVKGFPG